MSYIPDLVFLDDCCEPIDPLFLGNSPIDFVYISKEHLVFDIVRPLLSTLATGMSVPEALCCILTRLQNIISFNLKIIFLIYNVCNNEETYPKYEGIIIINIKL